MGSRPQPTYLRPFNPDAEEFDAQGEIHEISEFVNNAKPGDPRTARWPTAGPNRLTVSELWRQEVQPYLQSAGRRPATFKEYATHLAAWREFWSSRKASDYISDASFPTKEPPASAITGRILLAFRAWLLSDSRTTRSSGTINNYLKSIKSVLSIAAQKLEISLPNPRVELLPTSDAKSKICLQESQIEAVYAACDHAHWPRLGARSSCSTAAMWRTALVLWWHYGFRTQDLIRYETDHQALKWGNVCWDAECPRENSSVYNPHGWIWYVPEKTKRRKPTPLFLPMTSIVAAHLRAIEPRNHPPASRPIFDWPLNQSRLLQQWHELVNEARVKLKASHDGRVRRPVMQHLRQTCSTVHERNQAGTSSLVLGHAVRGDRAVTFNHYISAEEILVPAFAKLVCPPVFQRVFELNGRQLCLF